MVTDHLSFLKWILHWNDDAGKGGNWTILNGNTCLALAVLLPGMGSSAMWDIWNATGTDGIQ